MSRHRGLSRLGTSDSRWRRLRVAKGKIHVNGARLYFERLGYGPPLILIASEVSDRRVWNDQVAAFAQYYQVLRYDLRGYGKSSWVPGPFQHAQDLTALLDRLGIEYAALVGLQKGANVAVDFALEWPERVQALVLAEPSLRMSLHTALPPKTAVFQEHFMQQLGMAASEPWRVRRILKIVTGLRAMGRQAQSTIPPRRRHWRAAPRQTIITLHNALRLYTHFFIAPHVRGLRGRFVERMLEANPSGWLNPPAIDRLAELQVPTLVIAGEHITAMAREMFEMIQQGVAGAQLIVLPGAGITPPLEEPEAFNRAALEFLRAAYPPSDLANHAATSL